MWNEIRGMLLAKQRAEDEEREYRQQQRERERHHHHENEYDDDDDDARSIATVTGALDPVDEEEEPEEDFSHHERSLVHEQDNEQEHESEDRKQEHVRPRTPEPSLALQSSAPEPEPTPQPDYGSLIAELTVKVSQLTEQLVESRVVIRGLEEKVASLTMAPTTPPPVPNTEWMEKWEEVARRVGRVEETVKEVKEAEEERKVVEDVLPPSPRSLSSDSLRQRRRGRSASVRRKSLEMLTEVIKSNGVANGNVDLVVKKENGEVKVKETRRGLPPSKEATMTTLGIVILSVAAAAVIWKVKE